YRKHRFINFSVSNYYLSLAKINKKNKTAKPLSAGSPSFVIIKGGDLLTRQKCLPTLIHKKQAF
ncbi:hypothetical protein, partial [Sodaliphilus sp.]|uniref:hypothetical protein n=1 Tax=Sodaliphilus sp. TaxID=2815818 RepID=UPI00388DB596